jgi:hypothetical protein
MEGLNMLPVKRSNKAIPLLLALSDPWLLMQMGVSLILISAGLQNRSLAEVSAVR